MRERCGGVNREKRAQAEMRMRLIRARFSCKDSSEKMKVVDSRW